MSCGQHDRRSGLGSLLEHHDDAIADFSAALLALGALFEAASGTIFSAVAITVTPLGVMLGPPSRRRDSRGKKAPPERGQVGGNNKREALASYSGGSSMWLHGSNTPEASGSYPLQENRGRTLVPG